MLNNMFQGIFDTEMTTVIAVPDFLLCVGCALVIGLILAGAYMYGLSLIHISEPTRPY